MGKVKRSAVKGIEKLYTWLATKQQHIDVITRTDEEAEMLYRTATYTIRLLSSSMTCHDARRSIFLANGSVLMFCEDKGE